MSYFRGCSLMQMEEQICDQISSSTNTKHLHQTCPPNKTNRTTSLQELAAVHKSDKVSTKMLLQKALSSGNISEWLPSQIITTPLPKSILKSSSKCQAQSL